MATPSKIVGSFWFTSIFNHYSPRSFGIVKVKTSDGLRFYIGAAKGEEEKDGARHVSRYGTPLDTVQLKEFLQIPRDGQTPQQNPYQIQKVEASRNYHTEILAAMSIGIGLGLAIATTIL